VLADAFDTRALKKRQTPGAGMPLPART
jgi:hypothetical protein